MYEKEVGLIQGLIKDIDRISLDYLEIIDPIRNRSDVIIKRIFGDSSDYYKYFNEIIFPKFPKQKKYASFHSIYNSFIAIELEKAKTELIYLLNTMIKDLELKEKFYALDFVEKEWLPEDILSKGKDMSQYYILVYFIENSLRIFIDKICTDKYGENFIKKN